jgi:hypothetical protein
MTTTLKPLTATVELFEDQDICTITITNDDNTVVLGPLTHNMVSLLADWKASINDHLAQLLHKGMNITALVTAIPGIRL